jgi:NAD(P)-dependent dehydrogenase (short-subunit alcohol dehydrogenase family)
MTDDDAPGALPPRLDLTGRVAVVVGGGSGIGAAVTSALAGAGAGVACCDIDESRMAATVEKETRRGRRVVGHVADALDAAQLAGFYELVDTTFDRLDVLVNVVGGVRQRMFVDSSPEQWRDDVHRNYGYVLESTFAALQRMRAAGNGGSIVNFTTIEAHRGAPGFAVYAGAKAAVTNFSRSLAVELGPEQIRVNLLASDATPSRGNRDAAKPSTAPPVDPELAMRMLRSYIPMAATPPRESLADAVLFLASDLSRFVTGTTLHVDGGTWAASGFQRWPEPHGWSPILPAALAQSDAWE